MKKQTRKLKFTIDTKRDFDNALQLMEKGEFYEALVILRRAERGIKLKEVLTEEHIAIKLEIAECLSALDRPIQAIETLMPTIPFIEFPETVFFALIKNASLLENLSLAKYFFKAGKRLNIFCEEDEEELSYILDREPPQDNMELFSEEKETEYLIDKIKHLAFSNQLTKAIKLIDKVDKTDLRFVEVKSLLTILLASERKKKQAERMLNELVEVAPNDNLVLAAKIIVTKNLYGVKKVNQKDLLELDKLDLKNEKFALKTALAFFQAQDYDRAAKYFIRVNKPYDYDVNMALAYSYYKIGKKKESKAVMVRLLNIYPHSIMVRYYAHAYDADIIEEEEEFSLTGDEEMQMHLSFYFEDKIEYLTGYEIIELEAFDEALIDPAIYTAFRHFIVSGEPFLDWYNEERLVKRIALHVDFAQFLLLDPLIPNRFKVQLLERLFLDRKLKEEFLVSQSLYISAVDVTIPKERVGIKNRRVFAVCRSLKPFVQSSDNMIIDFWERIIMVAAEKEKKLRFNQYDIAVASLYLSALIKVTDYDVLDYLNEQGCPGAISKLITVALGYIYSHSGETPMETSENIFNAVFSDDHEILSIADDLLKNTTKEKEEEEEKKLGKLLKF